MGKAFVGLADDATAAYSNPAGLSNLLAKEFSFEIQGHGHPPRAPPPAWCREGPIETQRFGEKVWGPSFLRARGCAVQRWTGCRSFLNTVPELSREVRAREDKPVPGLARSPKTARSAPCPSRTRRYGLGRLLRGKPLLVCMAHRGCGFLREPGERRAAPARRSNPRNGRQRHRQRHDVHRGSPALLSQAGPRALDRRVVSTPARAFKPRDRALRTLPCSAIPF